MKRFICLIGLMGLIFCSRVSAQIDKTNILSIILKSQKKFYKNKIQSGNKEKYASILNNAKFIRPQVFLKIERVDSSFFNGSDTFNLVEGYDFAHGEIYGMIWKTDTIFTYVYGTMDNIPKFTPKKISELFQDQRDIVSNFDDWENAIYLNQDNVMPRLEGLYYFASKITYLPKEVVKTIAFCY